MLENRFQKQIGFIKNHSSKKNIALQPHLSSSDSFSSFEYDPQHKNDEFSPYKHPLHPTDKPTKKTTSQPQARPDLVLPPKGKDREGHPKFSNLILRNNFIQQTKSKQKEINRRLKNQLMDEEIQQINKEIREVKDNFKRSQEEYEEEEEELRRSETPKLAEEPNLGQQAVEVGEEEELSMSNINRFRKSQEEYASNPLPQQVEQNCPKTLAQYKKYLEESSSEEQLENKNTFKNKSHKLQKKEEEELITQWDKRQFKDKTIKTRMAEHNSQNVRPGTTAAQNGLMESRGGLCFEVDTRQFKAGKNRTIPQKRKKKGVEPPSREKLLIMRETAKRYDRESRVKLFGYI